jgi:hypothetical protein
MTEFSSGAKSTEIKPRYDLVPVEAVRYIAERLGLGAEHHGENNYKKGVNDPVFIKDRTSHAIEHLMNYANGNTTGPDKYGEYDTPIDHLKAAITNLAMLAWIEENRPEEAPEKEEATKEPGDARSILARLLMSRPAA